MPSPPARLAKTLRVFPKTPRVFTETLRVLTKTPEVFIETLWDIAKTLRVEATQTQTRLVLRLCRSICGESLTHREANLNLRGYAAAELARFISR